jgi:hypothetical protein
MATPTNLPAAQTTGNVLTAAYVNDLRGAFRILQVKESANDTTIRSSTSGTYVDTGLSVTITPQATTSTILCVYNLQTFTSGSGTGVGLRLVRGATTVVTDVDICYGTNSGIGSMTEMYYIDSPSTTSATTYKVQFARNQGANISYINASGAGVSRMYVMEISG